MIIIELVAVNNNSELLKPFLVVSHDSIRGFVRPWVRESVRPSVRPSVTHFFRSRILTNLANRTNISLQFYLTSDASLFKRTLDLPPWHKWIFSVSYDDGKDDDDDDDNDYDDKDNSKDNLVRQMIEEGLTGRNAKRWDRQC